MSKTKSSPVRAAKSRAGDATGVLPKTIDRRSRRRSHGPDRRSGKRVTIDMFANRFLDGQPFMCRMLDISRTGVRLAPILEPDPDRAPRYMGLQFQLPDREDVLTASGETIRRGGKTVGVRFTNLPPDSAWAIESFLSFV
ncbi:MAG TPA: PilZ domain-containing protein [Polyangia bacterium]|nr:PilZ domain-containing protein [Polyangia bacterium]